MAYEPTNPPTLPVFAPTTNPIDTYYIKTLTFRLMPGEPSQTVADVEWLEGFTDGAGQFIVAPTGATSSDPGGLKTATLQGAPLIAAMNAPVTPGMSIYDNVRTALWDLMEQEGLIPPGTVT
jgi:hypothetical protein